MFFMGLPPEVNSGLLLNGPGPGPLQDSAVDYGKVAAALAATAGAAEGSMSQMAGTWGGPAADRAESAFRNHANWLRAQSRVAAQAAAQATILADANFLARTLMPRTEVILANRVLSATLAATNTMAQNTALIAANEAAYLTMWIQAAETMYAYQSVAMAALAGLPTPAIPTPITSADALSSTSTTMPKFEPIPGGGTPSDTTGPNSGDTTGSGDNGPGTTSDPGAASALDPNPSADAGPTPGESPPSRPGPGEPAGQPTPETGPVTSEARPPISDVESLSPPADSLGDPGLGLPGDGGLPEQSGFYGTSPESTTLAGLNGGVGSVVALGMTRGGIGAMPGAATGFRLPANWNPMTARAFGAGTSSPVAPAVPPRSRPGVSAPRAQLRRRRDQEERKSAKAFAPGDPHEVPVLEQPPAIGVIEYSDGDAQPESASEQLLTVGLVGQSGDRPGS